MPDDYRIVRLGVHDRTQFDCGIEALDRYLRTQASQDVRRRVSNCFVALDPRDRIVGYYTFAAADIPISDLPPDAAKRLPRYRSLPAALIGRLAVDHRFQGRRLGESMVADAAMRAQQSAPAVFALLVDAKDERAAAFYIRMGFQPLASRPMTFFLTIAAAERALLTVQRQGLSE